jgi:hypothetical protein
LFRYTAELAARQWGIVDDDELRTCGFSQTIARIGAAGAPSI